MNSTEPRPAADVARVVRAETGAGAEDPGLVDVLIVLGRYRRLLAAGSLGLAAVTAAISLVLPASFTGVTRILPPQQAQSTATAMLSQLGLGLPGSAGAALGLKNPSDLYVAMLKSDTVADAL